MTDGGEVVAPPARLETDCCIAGGGPAGMLLGYLLARAGVKVIVLEKHADFLRDFRGDTVHPSTLEVMYQLGLLDQFLALPHDRIDTLAGMIGGQTVRIADFRFLHVHAPFVALMPQWDFLNFLAEQARRFPEFTLLMQAEAVDIVRQDGRVTGLTATTPSGGVEIAARLVVGADGRHSTVRERAGLVVEDLGAPMDVLWMRLPRKPDDPPAALGNIVAGRIFVMIPRGDYFQCGYVVAKGSFDEIRRQGLEALRASIVEISPLMKDRVAALTDWDQVKLLTVAVDRLKCWAAPGVLCIGDAAHAMSPIGGVGINLAIQDAVAAANILAPVLRARTPSLADLEAVQARREPPTKFMQGLQLTIQRGVIAPTLARAGAAPSVPWPAKVLNRVPLLRRIPARVMGLGTRFEAVRTPDVHAGSRSAAG